MNKNSIFGIHSLIGKYPFREEDLIYYFEWKVKNSKHGYFGTIHSFMAKMMMDYFDYEIEMLEQTYLCTGKEQNEYNIRFNKKKEVKGA